MTDNMPTSLDTDVAYAAGQLMLAYDERDSSAFRARLQSAAETVPMGIVGLVISMTESMVEMLKQLHGEEWREGLVKALEVTELEHSLGATDSSEES